MENLEEYSTDAKPTWCPGCGDFAIWNGIKTVLSELGLKPHEVLIVFGIGCSGNMANFIRTYGIHAIHGRTMPVATGVRLANHTLKVIVVGGDGDGYGIGMGHFIHAARRNIDVTYIVCDNQIYGLTTGQYSPTSQKGHRTKTTPSGSIDNPVNPIALALTAGATFVARGFAGDALHLNEILRMGLSHKGYSFIDVLQPCVTFNQINTYDFYRKRVYKLDEKHDRSSLKTALEKSFEWEEKIPLGIFYQTQKPTHEDGVLTIQDKPLVTLSVNEGHVDISKTLSQFQ